MRLRACCLGAGFAASAAILSCAASGLQGPPMGGPPGPMGFGGPFGGPPPMHTPSVAELPYPLIEKALHPTGKQGARIRTILRSFEQTREKLMPRPGPGGPFGARPAGGPRAGRPAGGPPRFGGPPTDMQKMMATFQAMDKAGKTASKQIDAVLSPAQRSSLKILLSDVKVFRSVGLPQDAIPDLKLTSQQRTRLNAIAKKAGQNRFRPPGPGQDPRAAFEAMMRQHETTRKGALGVLTTAQKAVLAKMRPSGPFGPGGPPRGGPGFGGSGPPSGGPPRGM